ncbi:hypothetical protein GCM10010358_76630 [Streptomyces minutiscleroticus]|uniref:Uncharacterized protein n=1 Tax=Streptomyces minutiscleroticus TaxID=68238 RepID=A0A918P1S9_9ACTN|nr:hypothetical protein [Streptomyces minutiscleroticus]GGY12934.1 hypothetical protein GCM10010358_76630 [Streptomyces minutiscleroticus]
MKGASDDAPVTYEDPATKEKTTHGTADGRKACLHHCVTYTATQAIVAGLGARALGIRVHPGAAAAALALSFGTHYIADRRVPGHGVLEKLADKTGKTNFYKLASHGMNGAFHLDILCTNGGSQGRQVLWGGRGRRSLDFQDDSRATDGPVLVHRDRLAGLEVSPLRGVEGCKSHRGTLAGPQCGSELDPQECDVEVLLTGWSAISDVPHRPQDTGSGEVCLPSVLVGWPKREVGADDPIASLVAAPVAPGRASLHPHLLGGRGEAFPELERKRVDVAEFLQDSEGHLPLILGEVVPDVVDRDVVLRGDLCGDQQGGGFQQLGDVHALILDHGLLVAAGGAR